MRPVRAPRTTATARHLARLLPLLEHLRPVEHHGDAGQGSGAAASRYVGTVYSGSYGRVGCATEKPRAAARGQCDEEALAIGGNRITMVDPEVSGEARVAGAGEQKSWDAGPWQSAARVDLDSVQAVGDEVELLAVGAPARI